MTLKRKRYQLDPTLESQLIGLVLPESERIIGDTSSKFDFMRPTVRDFIKQRLQQRSQPTLEEILAACVAAHGPAGKISKSGLARRLEVWGHVFFLRRLK